MIGLHHHAIWYDRLRWGRVWPPGGVGQTGKPMPAHPMGTLFTRAELWHCSFTSRPDSLKTNALTFRIRQLKPQWFQMAIILKFN